MKKIVTLGVTALALFALTACGNSSSSADTATISSLKKENKKLKNQNKKYKEAFEALSGDSSESSDSSSDSNDSASDPTYGLNKEYILVDTSNDEKVYSITINSASNKLSSDAADDGNSADNPYTKGSPANTIELKWQYKNYGIDEAWEGDVNSFAVYDDDGNAAANTSMQDGQTEISKGHAASSTSWFVLKKPVKDTKYLEIEYTDSDQGGTAKFKIPMNN